ncbi:MAG TPA: ABC-F family ATP-binding cassette domain-containing protein [Candidatus Acidoferrum sp.]|nr:ABC-F family ATP-binding cassette domain-containing protein [Candidatus Acidoferrum sp.]
MLNLQQVTKTYDGRVVLDSVNVAVNAGEVLALVGENGAGKTTLLGLLQGQLRPDRGTVTFHHEVAGYVAQEPTFGRTIIDCFAPGLEPWRMSYALGRVGLESLPGETLAAQLSGGQKTRLSLAMVLAADPEPAVLLLDEPTNNLDANGLAWLEGFIKSFHGAVVLVSHDRAFIDRVATAVAELHKGKLKRYGGNYTFYHQQKTAEAAAELQHYQQSVEERKRIEEMVRVAKDRARAGVNNKKPPDNDKFAKGFFNNRIQGKFSARAKSLESRLDHLEAPEKPELAKNYRLSLHGSAATPKLLLRLEHISKSFAGHRLLNDFNLDIRGGDRLHIAGPNGSGKTTLLKIAAGLLAPDSGHVTRGVGVTVGYLSQELEGLEPGQTALAALTAIGQLLKLVFKQARILGLTEPDLAKPVAALSRGQQAKLAFAKLLLAENQLLVLDEPTNHLDIPTREQIEAALRQYQGALLFASHDAYFVQSVIPPGSSIKTKRLDP